VPQYCRRPPVLGGWAAVYTWPTLIAASNPRASVTFNNFLHNDKGNASPRAVGIGINDHRQFSTLTAVYEIGQIEVGVFSLIYSLYLPQAASWCGIWAGRLRLS